MVFVNLIKACYSIQFKVIDETLAIFGVPPEIIMWVKKICLNSVVELKVGKFK